MNADREQLTVSFVVGGESRRFEFSGGQPRIGRGTDCDVHIADSSISRYHVSLAKVGSSWLVKDLGSRNGTYVADKRVTLHRLSSRDTVRIGAVNVSFSIGPSSQPQGDQAAPADDTIHEAHTLDSQNFNGLVQSVLASGDGDTFNERPAKAAARELLHSSSSLTADPLLGAAWIIKILRDASNSLLLHDSLNPILERVIDLVFEHLPATRGSILLYDAAKDELTPRVERALATGDASERVRISRHITEAAIRAKHSILVTDAPTDERFSCVDSIADMHIYSAVCAPLYNNGRVSGLIYADRRSKDETFTKTHLEVLSILASLSASAVERARLRETLDQEREVRERLARYHSPSVVEHILRRDKLRGKMLAEERTVSVLFCDIVGFTSMSENLTAMQTTNLLNEVFERLTHVVFREQGTLDKFIGDNIMVFFGAPLEQVDHAARAVRTGLEMQCALREFNLTRESQPPIGMRVGINSGLAVVGDIGASQRKDYTVIGDTVNVANRLESSACEAGQVVIGSSTYELVASEFECVPLAPFIPRGREQEIQPYLVLSGSPCPDP